MVLDYFLKYFPQNCIFCNNKCYNFDISPVCSNCFENLEQWGNSCIKCGKKLANSGICGECLNKENLFDFLFHIYSYEGKAKEFINMYKFRGAWYLSRIFSFKIFEILKNLPEKFQNSPITFVPAHPYRIIRRNYQPVEYLVEIYCKIFNKIRLSLLKKTAWKKPQTSLSKKMREKNVKGTFKIKGNEIPKSVILMDDIYTTGATISECAKILKKAGVTNVCGITLARTP